METPLLKSDIHISHFSHICQHTYPPCGSRTLRSTDCTEFYPASNWNPRDFPEQIS